MHTPSRWSPLVPILVCLGVLKCYGLHLQPGDEGIYFYLAKRMAEDGLIPYRDFFFAHPPVHLLVAGVAFELFGATPTVAKALAPLAALTTVAIVYAAALRRFGVIAAFVAAALLAGSYDFLRASSHFTGVNVTLALAMAAAATSLSGRVILGGVSAALAASAGLYALPTAFGCGVVAAHPGRRRLGAFAAAFAATAILLNGGFWLAAGDAFVEQVWLYHLAKPGKAWAGLAMARRVLIDNLGPTLGALIAAAELARRRLRDPRDRVAGLALLLGLGNLVALCSLQRAFPFYFLMMLPGLAVAGGYAGGRLYEALGDVLEGRLSALVPMALALAVALAGYRVSDTVRATYHPKTLGVRDKTYTWADAQALPAWANRAVRNLLWRDVRRAKVQDHGVARYLWHESRRWPLFPEVTQHILAVTTPEDTLFGDSLTAPYLAFLTGRRVAGDEADSNAARFRSKVTSPDEVIERVQAPEAGLRLVVARPGRGFYRVREFQAWIRNGWAVERVWSEPIRGRLLLLKRH